MTQTVFSWLKVLFSDTYYPYFFGLVCTITNYMTAGREMKRRALWIFIPIWYIAGVLLAKYFTPELERLFNRLFPD